METCEILLTTMDGQIVVGTIAVEGEKIVAQSKDGYELLMKDLLNETHTINKEEVSARQDPRSWFATLPQKYNGTYLRARFV